MGGKCVKLIRLPGDLKARVQRLARSNGLTCAELIRHSIEAKLPDCETGKHLLSDNDNKRLAKDKSG
jgi:predicted DNA-binding protein